MSEKLTVGFWAGIDFNYNDPRFTAAQPAIPNGQFGTMTIGGPRTRERVLAEIDACQRTLDGLLIELARFSCERERGI